MEENPYAKHLDGRELLTVLAATPAHLRELLGALPAEEIDRAPGPDKWSLREITAHLADCEIVFSWRIRQTLAVDGPTLQPFAQDVWGQRYAAYDFDQALTTFEALRAWNLRLLRTLTEADRQRPATHPERGALTLQTILETIAGHDLHHLKLMEGLLKRESKETVPSPS